MQPPFLSSADGHVDDDPSQQGRFAVRRKLGEGGMGVVYEAFDRELQTNVALKTFLRFGPKQLYRLKQEFRALAELSHPNLVTLYELILANDTFFISMELIRGAQSFLEHVRPLDPNATEHASAPVDASIESRSRPSTAAAPTRSILPETTMAADDATDDRTLGTMVIAPAPARAPEADTATTADGERSVHRPLLAPTPTQTVAMSGPAPHGTTMVAQHPQSRLQSIEVVRREARNPLAGTYLDMGRLRPALRQLCQGVHALHAMGKIHRDLKPRNVLVDANHRVVICDFGLVTEIKEERDDREAAGVEGTIAYMSPEQAANERLTFASDWFAVGVMLYEALTARRPFPYRNLEDIRVAHRRDQVVRPREIVPDVPEDLEQLCLDLLAISPELRPAGTDVLARLGVTAPTLRARLSNDRPLFGRTPQLTSLMEAYDATRKGRAIVQFVRGDPGIGKSALAARFRDTLPKEVAEDIVTLSARCHASESVPYNAIDGLIDSLSSYLKSLQPAELKVLLPAGVGELARMFPVLQWVDAVYAIAAAGQRAVDEHERRRQAFSALTEIFRRLAADHSLILFVDNFQHCDRDSARLLIHILDSHPPIPLMLIACEKHVERGVSWFERQLVRRQQQGTWSSNIEIHDMTLPPLSIPQSRALARLLLDEDEAFQVVERIVHEAAGNPLYLEELTTAWARRRARTADLPPDQREADLKKYAGRMKIERVLLEPTHTVSPEARTLLRIAAVAGRPMAQGILYQAAELGRGARLVANSLRTERLVRVEGLRETDRIEVAHDGLKAAMLSTLAPPLLEKLHRALATAMVGAQSTDHEALAEHWVGANEPARARESVVAAAERAAHALAFDRAARLYRRALDLRVANREEESRELRRHLAEALARAGHGVEAAAAFLTSARGSTAADAIECRRRAAELYFQSGRVDEGMTVLYEALASYGMRMPRNELWAGTARAGLRARLAMRGFRYRERDDSEVADVENKRADLCTSVLLMLALVDSGLGSQLHARNLLRSLDVGEPKRLARAIALEPVYLATRGAHAYAKETRATQVALEIATESDDPETVAFTHGAAALSHYLRARFDQALAASERALELHRTAARAHSFEANNARLVNLWSLYYLGHIEAFVERARNFGQDADARGDSFMFANLSAGIPCAGWLFVDDPRGAEWSASEAVNVWPARADRHIQGYWEAFAIAQTELYSGNKGLAWNKLEAAWPRIAEGTFMRARFIRAEAWHLRARCAIDAAAAGTRQQVPMMRQARRAVAALLRRRTPVSLPWARMVRAGIRYIEGERAEAIQLLADAEEELTKLDMALYAVVARQRRGELLRNEEGQDLIDDVKRWMQGRRIANAQAVVACLAPGFPRAR